MKLGTFSVSLEVKNLDIFLNNLKSIYEGGVDLREKEFDLKELSCS